jgi:hypothetical protein
MKKKEESGGTSPDRAYDEKKTKSLGRMLASGTIPRHILVSYPGHCHLITFLSFLRPLSGSGKGGDRTPSPWAVDGG